MIWYVQKLISIVIFFSLQYNVYKNILSRACAHTFTILLQYFIDVWKCLYGINYYTYIYIKQGLVDISLNKLMYSWNDYSHLRQLDPKLMYCTKKYEKVMENVRELNKYIIVFMEMNQYRLCNIQEWTSTGYVIPRNEPVQVMEHLEEWEVVRFDLRKEGRRSFSSLNQEFCNEFLLV